MTADGEQLPVRFGPSTEGEDGWEEWELKEQHQPTALIS